MGLNKILSGLTGTLALLMAVAILAMAGCGDDDDNGLGQVTVGDDTYDICESTEDCSDDEVCEGSTTVEGEAVDYCVEPEEEHNNDDPNTETDQCNAEEVCQEYCFQKVGRCMDENCSSESLENPETGDPIDLSASDLEMELCMDGLQDSEGTTVVSGCLDRAGTSSSLCEQVQDEADTYAEQDCNGQEQLINQCVDALAYRTGLGTQVQDRCECEPASTAEDCERDEDCSAYGNGLCLQGQCTAGCYDFDGNPPEQGFSFDSTCAPDGLGICFHLDGGSPESPPSVCQRACSGEDCPSDGSACVPQLGVSPEDTDDPFNIGVCTSKELIEPGLICDGDDGCEESGACIGGLCYAACTDEDDCNDEIGPGTTCNQEAGHCDPNFEPLDETDIEDEDEGDIPD